MTPSRSEVEREVLEELRPTREEVRLRDELFVKTKSVLEDVLKKRGLEGEVTLQGSARKGTWLRGSLELDVFVLFPPKDKEWIKEVAFPALLEAARALGEPEVRFAEHPYVRTVIKGVPVEIVPAFKVRSASEAITAVDRTPFHTEWFLQQVRALGDWIRDEVRLLKAFMKGIGVYGAEIAVQGFSGFLCEVLATYYKGFRGVIEAAAREWRPPTVLETSLPKEEALKRFEGPLVVPDPTDPKRNAAAAVSLNAYSTFIIASKLYSVKPSKKFFFPPKPAPARPVLPTYVVEVPALRAPPETVWGELRRVAKSLVKNLRSLGFEVTRFALWSDGSAAKIALEFLQDSLPEWEVAKGPPAWSPHALRFLRDKESWWVDEGRLFARRKRKYTEAKSAIADILKKLKAKSLILENSKIERVELAEERWLAEFVSGRPPWS
ncbi:CCA tRNA nucleotidyltransferase [Ignicoccus hospitalis]|uniref:CCA-adding enzyme n=1 Tax=Ignicoccus hospitalis (strain KIN4/I / DSM 18386 / JCM 14125) TaxID=453591 RepID=A8AAS9_IGNH4|nr:CCA tRNA nucleotidyltransferase [Ignicoccus hospitalis]ABU82031.1 tRNA adenylyltransferase [Ignicoccus hospitalis KIN4/I]HIH90988.1 CCA tRNA nucleotidyltransferase [Desulfurococcaceae archaeon]